MIRLTLIVGVLACMASAAAAQPPVGALAIDARQGDQYGWAVDYETAAAAQARALDECGGGCRVVLTFNRCAAYAADQDADSTAVGWAESFTSSSSAQQAALSECSSRGGSGCVVRVWGCNGPVVEEGLGLDRGSRQQIQRGLQSAGFDPGGADGLFGPRTRAAIRGWQTSRGSRATGYLDGASVAALRVAPPGVRTFREREPAGADTAAAPAVSAPPPPAASAELEGLFWQSVMNSTNPSEFEAYLRRFPNGVFSDLAQNRLEAIRGPAGSLPSGSPSTEASRSSGRAAGGDVRPRPGAVFRPDQTCAGQPVGSACWQEMSRQPGCYVWNPYRTPDSTVTWTGECDGGLAQGMGTLAWVWDGGRQTNTGRIHEGRQIGNWVLRPEDGSVQEGPLVDGEPNGHWILRFADGGVEEGPLVDARRNGLWVIRDADGTVGEGPFVNGERNGSWVIRFTDGTVEEWVFRDGERVR